MNIDIFGFFKKLQEKKESRILETRKALAERRTKLEGLIQKEKDAMLGSPCAIRGSGTCQDICVHFSEGYLMESWYHEDERQFIKVSPRCKLWNN